MRHWSGVIVRADASEIPTADMASAILRAFAARAVSS
jgi:hypothetical protein